MSDVRIVFFGSPEFAVPILRALAEESEHDVGLVVTQGAKSPSPVAQAAKAMQLPIYTPETLRDEADRAPLEAVGADVFVVAAFGLIFRRATLAIPRLGSINVHPSLLPMYRGASPIPAAIACGDTATGVSLMLMDAGIDTGAVISQEIVAIEPTDTTESLAGRLAETAAAQLLRDLPRWADGELDPVAQPDTGATVTRTLRKADGWIDWSRPAIEIERHVRAMWPWPRAWTTVDDGVLLQLHQAAVAAEDLPDAAPGTVISERRRLIVACGVGALEVLTVEPAGRRTMAAGAYLNGRRSPLVRLGDAGNPGRALPLVAQVS